MNGLFRSTYTKMLKQTMGELRSTGGLAINNRTLNFRTRLPSTSSIFAIFKSSIKAILNAWLGELQNFLSEFEIIMKLLLKNVPKQPTVAKNFTIHWTLQPFQCRDLIEWVWKGSCQTYFKNQSNTARGKEEETTAWTSCSLCAKFGI